VGPDEDIIGPPAGGSITLRPTEKAVDDWVAVTNMAGSILYDIGDQKGLMWDTTGSFYMTHNFDYDEFDFTNWRVSTGPWWVTENSVLKLPGAYSKNYYDHDSLFRAYEFSPSYEYFFTKNISLRGLFSYYDIDYRSSSREGQDSVNRIWEINPNLYLNHHNDIISLFLSHESNSARSKRYSYDGINVGVSYFKRFPWDMEFYVRYRYSDREYEAPAPLWIDDREDDRQNVYAALSQNFRKHFFASVYFNWIDNDSNTELYTYDKTIYGLSLGLKF
jgi:hypothetical protein